MNFLKRIYIRNIYNLSKYYYQEANFLCYKSSLSLDKLYPNSKTAITTPLFKNQTKEKFDGFIPIDKLQITYSASSGPGGQNVNCVNTKVDLRFHVESAEWLSEELRNSLKEQVQSKLTKDGMLIIRSDKTRYQHMNLADALHTLRGLIWKAAEPKEKEISQETLEKIKKRKEKATKERLIEKRMRSSIKQDRQSL